MTDVCIACGTSDWRPYCRVRDVQIVCCQRCGLGTWDWPSFDPRAFYGADYWQSTDPTKGYADYLAHAYAMERTHRQRLRWLTRELHAASRSRSLLLVPSSGSGPTCPRGGPDLITCKSTTGSAGGPLADGRGLLSTSARSGAVERPRLLDAGCGPGFFVRSAQRFGFAAEGIEVSEYAVDYACRELGVNVRQGQVTAADLPPGPFDVVTMWDVIEHLPTPAESLAAVHAGMMPGGIVAVSTGDLATPIARLSGWRWHLFNLPEHLWFFTAASLQALLRHAGFEVVRTRYEMCWYSVSYLAERLERKVQLRVPTLGLGRLAVPVTLGDIVTVLARKTEQQ